ncbi:MAG: hypothetical protein JKX83_05665 [Pseudomonadales bacterium]|nr:hypothetical protein [Pseudomonadales bacterium]
MNKNLQWAAVLSLSIALTACGGGSSSGTSTSTSVSGTASKGIIIGGTVNAYPLVNGVTGAEVLGTAVTDEEGKYSLDLPSDYDGSPIVVIVTPAADGTTLMRCDIPSGCGTGTAFGSDYTLVAGGFSMSAILPEATAGQTVTVNPTPLTDIAAHVALDALAGVIEPTEFMIEQAISDANTATADRFGITGDLNGQPVIDVTDPVAVAAASTDAIIYNSLAAAIVEATQDDDAALNIEEALEKFVEDYVENGGISGNTSTPGTTSLSEILVAAQEVLVKVSELEGGDELDLTAVTTELTTSTSMVDTEEADVVDSGTPSDTAADAEIAQVKAMVANLRDIGASVSIDLTNSINAFSVEVALSSFVLEQSSTDAMNALSEAGAAVVEAMYVYSTDPTLTTHTAKNGLEVSLSNITGTETETGLSLSGTIAVAGVVNDNTVDMTFTLGVSGSVAETGTWAPDYPSPALGETDSGSASSDISAEFSFSISGMVTNQSVELNIVEGAVVINATIDETETWTHSNTDGVVNVDEDELFHATLDFSFDLEVSLVGQTSGFVLSVLPTEPFSFVGKLALSVEGVEVSEEETFDVVQNSSTDEYSEVETWDSTTTFDTLNVSFSGTFAQGSQSFAAAFALSAAGNGVSFQEMGSWAGGWSSTEGWQQSETGLSSDTETTTKYADIGISLSFEAVLTGFEDSVAVTFGASRSGIAEGNVSLDLAWDGNRLNFDATGGEAGGNATVSNQDGVSMVITVNAEDVLSGTLSKGDTEYASINEQGVIRYVDGVIESL